MTGTHSSNYAKDSTRGRVKGVFLVTIGISLLLVWLILAESIIGYLCSQEFFGHSSRLWLLLALSGIWTAFMTVWASYVVDRGITLLRGKL